MTIAARLIATKFWNEKLKDKKHVYTFKHSEMLTLCGVIDLYYNEGRKPLFLRRPIEAWRCLCYICCLHAIICRLIFNDIQHDLTHIWKMSARCCVHGCGNRVWVFSFDQTTVWDKYGVWLSGNQTEVGSLHHSDVIMNAITSQITGGIDCLLNRWFRHRSKEPSKLCVTGLCKANSPVTGEFPAQRASNAEMLPFDDVIM